MMTVRHLVVGPLQACGASSRPHTRPPPSPREDVAGAHCCVPRPNAFCAPLPSRSLGCGPMPQRDCSVPAVSGLSFASHSFTSHILSQSAGGKNLEDQTYVGTSADNSRP